MMFKCTFQSKLEIIQIFTHQEHTLLMSDQLLEAHKTHLIKTGFKSPSDIMADHHQLLPVEPSSTDQEVK